MRRRPATRVPGICVPGICVPGINLPGIRLRGINVLGISVLGISMLGISVLGSCALGSNPLDMTAAGVAVTGSVASTRAASPPVAARTATAGAPQFVPAYDPARLRHLGDARQVVVVTATSWSTSYATVRTYRKDGTGWHEELTPMTARIGRRGFAALGTRQQASGETPAGTFALLRAFGAAADPGTALPYRQFDRNDWWPYDPSDPRTYNVAQFHGRSSATRWRPSRAEHLWDLRQQYAYAVVLDYNLPTGIEHSGSQRFAARTADTRAGGGIFLHVRAPRPTSGCVAVSRTGMRRILGWLDPAQHPVIVMAPISAIGRA
jgi:L,D-peptidoglycan transpeptidase YkuD (ErfK/YbiS/YcfS/YnhG family)